MTDTQPEAVVHETINVYRCAGMTLTVQADGSVELAKPVEGSSFGVHTTTEFTSTEFAALRKLVNSVAGGTQIWPTPDHTGPAVPEPPDIDIARVLYEPRDSTK